MATIRELRAKASDLKIPRYSRMNKVELQAAVTAAEASWKEFRKDRPKFEVVDQEVETVQDYCDCAVAIIHNLPPGADRESEISALLSKCKNEKGTGATRKLRQSLQRIGFNRLASLKAA